MSDAVIKELRRLRDLGLITPAHRLRAERYVRATLKASAMRRG